MRREEMESARSPDYRPLAAVGACGVTHPGPVSSRVQEDLQEDIAWHDALQRPPPGWTTGRTCRCSGGSTCGRCSPTIGRSSSARSRCGRSSCCCVTGVFLTFWFTPRCRNRRTRGPTRSCAACRCPTRMPRPCTSAFDVRGGLLVRQMHHWAAMLFIAAMLIHLIRNFVSGAFRKPREITWVIGATMLLLGVLEGFAGYSCRTTCSPGPACASPTAWSRRRPSSGRTCRSSSSAASSRAMPPSPGSTSCTCC